MASTSMSPAAAGARWSCSAQSDGTLVVDQVLRGSLGLEQPDALAVDPTTGDVYVASQQGLGFGGGGLASFTPATGTAPARLALGDL